ncbi:protein SLX4IP [Astyanax mexicanus]|uniref:protein SLX4IP n=1 Tax=Astyanax mexicanus TaxID=7994 RepID=UPI0020CB69FB|nr:protein SLX4IP [Astyanax mexicanus]
MQLSKFVIKCGSFAVLVDLHVLPQSGEESSSSWFSEEHREEVSALIKDAVDQRVRQFLEARQGPTKQKKELSPHNPLCIKGGALLLAAYFMKRHVNLRCVLRHNRHKLRVFPERFVVCVSRSDENTAPAGSTKPDVTEQSGPSRSGYFSSSRETLHPLNISTITKMAALQKIRARQVDAHPPTEPEHETHNQNQKQGAAVTQTAADGVEEVGALEEEDEDVQRGHEADKVKADDSDTEKIEQDFQVGEGSVQSSGEHHAPEHEPNVPPNPKTTRRRRRLPSSPGPAHQQAKRVCLREPGGGSGRPSSRSSELGPRSSRPGASAGAGSGSEGVLEEELLTHGKQPQPLPLGSSISTKHITHSLRVLSAESESSGSSTGPRTAADKKPSAPRVSRLRRVKKP